MRNNENLRMRFKADDNDKIARSLENQIRTGA